MPIATLLFPRTFTLLGRQKFVQHEPTTVTDELASYLSTDPRFSLDWQGVKPHTLPAVVVPEAEAEVILADEAEVGDTGNGTTVREALDLIDGALETDFEDDGRPSLEALSRIVGRPVSAEERDAALIAATRTTPAVEADSGAGPARTRIIRKKADPTTEGAQEV
jgi:hypothetical protein